METEPKVLTPDDVRKAARQSCKQCSGSGMVFWVPNVPSPE